MRTLVFSEGFHGTTPSRADGIRSSGFDCEDGVVCFATPDNLEMAHEFGRYRATLENVGQYAVIHAEFPATEAELWPIPFQIRIPSERASSIAVKSVTLFKLGKRGLHLPVSTKGK